MKLQDELILKINLQLFADPEDEGRTEEPSEKKRREAREKGKVAKTSELSSALVLLICFFILSLMAKGIMGDMMNFMRGIFNNLHSLDFTIKNYRNVMVLGGVTTAKIVLPVLLAAMSIAFLADVLQVGFQFSLHPLKPELSKISFTFEKLTQKILFSRQVGVNLLKAVLKIIIIAGISILIVRSDHNSIIKTINMGLMSSIKVVSWTAFKVVLWISVVMIIFSLFDFMYQKWEHLKSLKMTIPEVKEERKQYEGDPFIKARQRERYRALAMRKIIEEVPKADVVVTNPTHYSVALKYDDQYMNAAQVTAKAVDLIAKTIKEVAKENDVPIVENRELARTLFSDVPIGKEIPQYLFESVVEIYRIVYMREEEAI